MRRTFLTMTAMAAMTAGWLMAGGFWLELGNPEASPEARKANAVFTVRAVGCHDPASANVTATAIGIVNGQKKTLPIELTKLSTPGMYAVSQQWPKEGKWVIQLVGKNGEQFTNSLVTAGPQGVDRLHAKADMHAFASQDIDALLR
jgi:hypothetical protein